MYELLFNEALWFRICGNWLFTFFSLSYPREVGKLFTGQGEGYMLKHDFKLKMVSRYKKIIYNHPFNCPFWKCGTTKKGKRGEAKDNATLSSKEKVVIVIICFFFAFPFKNLVAHDIWFSNSSFIFNRREEHPGRRRSGDWIMKLNWLVFYCFICYLRFSSSHFKSRRMHLRMWEETEEVMGGGGCRGGLGVGVVSLEQQRKENEERRRATRHWAAKEEKVIISSLPFHSKTKWLLIWFSNSSLF